MSKRSIAFKKNIKFRKENNFENNSMYINGKKIDDQTEYSILSNIFCSMLGLTKNEMRQFIHKNIIPELNDYKLITKDAFKEMQLSLNKAFKAGEDKEHERHFREEQEAYERGVKYGREQRENEIKEKIKKDSNNWIQREREKISDPPDWYIKEKERYSDPDNWMEKEKEKVSDDIERYIYEKRKNEKYSDLNNWIQKEMGKKKIRDLDPLQCDNSLKDDYFSKNDIFSILYDILNNFER